MPHGLSFIPLPKCKEVENLLMYEIISFKTAEEKLIYTTGHSSGFLSDKSHFVSRKAACFISFPFMLHTESLAFIHVYAYMQTGNNKKKYLQWWQLYVLIVIQHHGLATARGRRILQRDENIPLNKSHRSLGSTQGLLLSYFWCFYKQYLAEGKEVMESGSLANTDANVLLRRLTARADTAMSIQSSLLLL